MASRPSGTDAQWIAGARPKDGSKRIISEKTLSEFPLADSVVLNQIKDAEQTAKQAAAQIAQMRDAIQCLTQKDELSPREMEELQKKQKDIVCKLAEFEEVTKRIQELVGLAGSAAGGGPCPPKDKRAGKNGAICDTPCQPYAPGNCGGMNTGVQGGGVPDLPKVVIPPLGQASQVAQVMVCEPVEVEGEAGYGGEMWFQAAQAFQLPEAPGAVPELPVQPIQPEDVIPSGLPQDLIPPGQPTQDPIPVPEQAQAILEQLSDKLDASYKIQEKLAQENKEMESERYQLQEELLSRDKQTDHVGKQLESLQNQFKLISSENSQLKKQVQSLQTQTQACCQGQGSQKPLCRMSLNKDPICKMDLYKQMGIPLPTAGGPGLETIPAKSGQQTDMETVVSTMEEEVRAMQKELSAVQAERRSLDLQKKLLKCAAPQPTTNFPVCKKQAEMGASTASKPELIQPLPPPPPPPPQKPTPQCMRELETQLKELSEQYCQLKQDYCDKVAEVSLLRVEADKFREEKKCLLLKKDEEQTRMDNLLTRVKTLEDEREKWSSSKDVMLDIEQQMVMFKQKYLEKQELEEEMKLLISEQALQLDEYRNKYLKAQEIVEGQRRDMDLMQKNHLRFSEQLTKELKTAKEEFQKRLEELSQLPDVLKGTQQKLQETQQIRIMAEKKVEQLTANLEELKEKLEVTEKELEILEAEGKNENENDQENVEKLRFVVSELEEKVLEFERQVECKRQHVVMLEGQLECVREESARSVTRTKERCEVVRRGLQNQISDLEVQLAQARASARSAQKDRDQIREKMECQVQKLTQNFEEAQGWVKCLQSHVSFLKTSNRDLEFPSPTADCLPKAFRPIAID